MPAYNEMILLSLVGAEETVKFLKIHGSIGADYLGSPRDANASALGSQLHHSHNYRFRREEYPSANPSQTILTFLHSSLRDELVNPRRVAPSICQLLPASRSQRSHQEISDGVLSGVDLSQHGASPPSTSSW